MNKSIAEDIYRALKFSGYMMAGQYEGEEVQLDTIAFNQNMTDYWSIEGISQVWKITQELLACTFEDKNQILVTHNNSSSQLLGGVRVGNVVVAIKSDSAFQYLDSVVSLLVAWSSVQKSILHHVGRKYKDTNDFLSAVRDKNQQGRYQQYLNPRTAMTPQYDEFGRLSYYERDAYATSDECEEITIEVVTSRPEDFFKFMINSSESIIPFILKNRVNGNRQKELEWYPLQIVDTNMPIKLNARTTWWTIEKKDKR